jgi:hypothetical protein
MDDGMSHVYDTDWESAPQHTLRMTGLALCVKILPLADTTIRTF